MIILNCSLILFFIFLISSIDFNDNEIILNSFKLKNICSKVTILHFLIVTLTSFYINFIFGDNIFLYFINLFCFFAIYICSITDIYLRCVYDGVIFLFFIIISLLNLCNMYFKVAFFSFLTALFLYGMIYFLTKIIYKKEVFGVGDIYVLSIVAISTDSFTVFNIGLFSFVVAAFFYLVKIIFSRDFKRYKEYKIPFVPFILISYLIMIYF